MVVGYSVASRRRTKVSRQPAIRTHSSPNHLPKHPLQRSFPSSHENPGAPLPLQSQPHRQPPLAKVGSIAIMGLFRSSYPTRPIDQAGSRYSNEAVLKNAQVATYDYIIVGGGTAGCCLASRLSEDPAVTVLLLERGPVTDTFLGRIPLPSGDIGSKSTPVVHSPTLPVVDACGQTLHYIQAETLGGGSSVNSMLYTRGAKADFDRWGEIGHPSWNYEAMEPYFIKSENALSHSAEFHGTSESQKAAASFGLSPCSDLNSPHAPVDVCAVLDNAISLNCMRISTYTAYLPADVAETRRARLTICTRALASKIVVEDGVAVGVIFESGGADAQTQAVPGKCRFPDLEVMLLATYSSITPPYPAHLGIFSFLVAIVQPKSTGSVRLASADPHARPVVDIGLLRHPDDIDVLRKGAHLATRLAAEVTKNGYPMKAYEVPPEGEGAQNAYIREKVATLYHYTSSCRMGKREDGAVVDHELNVYGVEGLRVCDASVFPSITSGHTMAPVIAVAEKCADMMKHKYGS
ncbi:Alcohol oxidase [Mycena kentingensis (nom. inval.)]|nr:Alcohol oxidase [Mycena kentingensis (nom. inval.)]